DRAGEHEAVLAELVGHVARLKPDAFLISGDVFDHHNPSGASLRLFYETLLALHRAAPDMTTVVTAGNHDAAGRLESARALLATMNIHVVGNVHRTTAGVDPRNHLVMLRDAKGQPAANVLAVSYPTASCLPPFASLESVEGQSPIVAATRTLYRELVDATGATQSPLPLVVMGHLHVAGGTESEGAERRILVGGQHAVGPDVFPPAAYVALGHLHKAQQVGAPNIRYSGSLLPLSAAELGYAHGIALVTIDGGAASVEHIALMRPVRFERIPARGDIAFADLQSALAALAVPANAAQGTWPFAQVNLSRQALPPGYRADADRLAETHRVRIVDLRVARPPESADAKIANTNARLAELDPEELFAGAFEKAHARAPEQAHRDAFHALIAATGEEA
ncbi:MAG TPA: exonuclease SbcCD subunit D, partial [Hyphomicrobiaceae bacterium]|nr:exonuclease SbcCD subunit D [Hyphomicrobiaceae bacterium]